MLRPGKQSLLCSHKYIVSLDNAFHQHLILPITKFLDLAEFIISHFYKHFNHLVLTVIEHQHFSAIMHTPRSKFSVQKSALLYRPNYRSIAVAKCVRTKLIKSRDIPRANHREIRVMRLKKAEKYGIINAESSVSISFGLRLLRTMCASFLTASRNVHDILRNKIRG